MNKNIIKEKKRGKRRTKRWAFRMGVFWKEKKSRKKEKKEKSRSRSIHLETNKMETAYQLSVSLIDVDKNQLEMRKKKIYYLTQATLKRYRAKYQSNQSIRHY